MLHAPPAYADLLGVPPTPSPSPPSPAVKDDKRAALREIIRRKRCQDSLHSYALNVDVPTAPTGALCPDEDLFGPARMMMPLHQAVCFDVLQRAMTTPYGRAIIMMPPGCMKSISTDVVGTTWCMGRIPGTRLILTSYASKIAERQSRRAQQLVQQELYKNLWDQQPVLDRDAAGDWNLSNGSEMLAMGLTAGLTGNRANGFIVDDPHAGREEADSVADRQNVLDAYQDDLLSRLLPGAWGVIIQTRWHEADLSGSILPEGYAGQSGLILCRDGLTYDVLNIPAKCEALDDPIGREPGEYLWTNWFPQRHWQMYENATGPEAARAWASLYQQRPATKGDGRFTLEMFDLYKPGTQPPLMAFIGASDHAVTAGKNDFTEMGVFGVDSQGDLWEVDWWNKQCLTDESADKLLDMVKRWRTSMWFNEGGVIDKAMGPLINLRMRQRAAKGERVYTDRRALPSMQDKVAKCSSFQGRAASGAVHFRDNANSRRVIQQLIALPAGRFDDAADVCGLVGRAVDQFPIVRAPAQKKREAGIKPFTGAWVECDDRPPVQKRYR